MLDETRSALVKYRLEQARECYETSVLLLNADMYKDAANRSYYCVFHAMRSVLAVDGFDSKKHSGVISAFQQKYIKTSVFPVEFSKIIRNCFIIRGRSDYEDFFVISKEDVDIQIENAKTILTAVEAYVESL